jgi:hypothetical protein
MAYFAASLAFLLVGLASMACGFGLVTTAIDAPETFAVVHLVVIGWLGLLFSGALLQFVPVLAATQLRMPWLAVPALACIVTGLLLLVLGFLALGARVDLDPRLMSMGGLCLALGFGLVIVSLSATLLSQHAVGFSAALVLVGFVSLLATVLSGNAFAAALSGAVDLGAFGARITAVVPVHAAAGVLGWMTLTAIGVSDKLFGMFLLAPERQGDGRPLVALAAAAICLVLAALALSSAAIPGADMAGDLGLGCAVILVALYGRDVRRMVGTRRRKVLELNSIAGLAAIGFLVAGLALLVAAQVRGGFPVLGPAAFYLLGLGWLSGLGLAQLYKIVPFLTWLETYGPVMGRHPVPRVQDLVNERRAALWFAAFYGAVGLGALAIVAGSDLLLRAASVCQTLAVMALGVEYIRARRLVYAPEPLRLPPGAVRPHLIHATIKE